MLKDLGWLRGDDLILVARIAAVVLAIEIPVAVVATTLPVSPWAMSLIDAALLVLICAPVIFFWVVRPYVLARDLAEQAMKKSADQLRVRNEQFNAALQNMQHGLAMFDAQQRLIVCNARYAHMYGLSLDDVLPGTPLSQIVEARIQRGIYAFGSPEAYRRELLGLAKERASSIEQFSDGRWFAMSREPLASGGWVSTHKDVTERYRVHERIAFMARHDSLTGLPNRAFFNDTLDQALSRAKQNELVAVHLLDLDRFKYVNDTLGHEAGDKLLQGVTGRLRGAARESDVIARMGGDEFAIVQSALSHPADAAAMAQRIVEAISQPYEIDGQSITIGVSIGIALFPRDGHLVDQIMRNSDLALYRAKGKGRGLCEFFEPEMEERLLEEHIMERDLQRAVANGELELFFQPFVDLEGCKVTGCEALLRWHHPIKGLISPADFIPLAERTELINAIGEWTLRQACAIAAGWPEETRVSVNMSAVQLRHHRALEMIVSALVASDLSPRRLEIEVTETAVLESTAETLNVLRSLRELGVSIAMDDFGTGYASLSYLQKFEFDRLKIDPCFIKNIITDPSSYEIVRAVAMLANGLGMDLTVEGIETHEQLEAVRSVHCTEGQGFLFSRPRPAHEIGPLLESEELQLNGKIEAAA